MLNSKDHNETRYLYGQISASRSISYQPFLEISPNL